MIIYSICLTNIIYNRYSCTQCSIYNEVNRREIYREWNNKGAPKFCNISLSLPKIVIDHARNTISDKGKDMVGAMCTVFDIFLFDDALI